MITLKITVKGLNTYLENLLVKDVILSSISVIGEISNLKYNNNGNVYFSIKEDDYKVDCIMFENYTHKYKTNLENGMKIICYGSVKYYNKSGICKLHVYKIENYGEGNILQKFMDLKKELKKLGLFDEKHKIPIPKFPFNIGIITSITGAALQDILNVHRRKNAISNLIVYPSLMQGNNASGNIISGLNYFNNKKNIDLIIIARGGGSMEDLWCFNDKSLCEQIYNSNLPIISAIGHEIDYTMVDYVSDLRVPTPSIAGELTFFSKDDFVNLISLINTKIKNINMMLYLKNINQINSLQLKLKNKSPEKHILKNINQINIIKSKLTNVMKNKVLYNYNKIEKLDGILKSKNPNSILNRGHICANTLSGEIILTLKDIIEVDKIVLTFSDGKAIVKIIELEEIH